MTLAQGAASLRKAPLPLLAATLAIMLAALVVQAGVVEYREVSRPAAALALDHGAPIAMSREADILARSADPSSRRRGMALAREALRTSPLLADPFVTVAEAVAGKDAESRALQLMEAARLRDPRNLKVRFWLYRHYLLAGDIASAIGQVDAITQLDPGTAAPLSAALVPLLTLPAGRDAIVAALARNPSWQGGFLVLAERLGTDRPAFAETIFRLAGASGARIDGRSLASVLGGMVARGEYDQAHVIFRHFADPAGGSDDSMVFDGGFSGVFGAPPFGWTFLNGVNGSAGLVRQGGATALQVRRFGHGGAVLAQQVQAAKPGRYALEASVAGDGTPLDGSFAWELGCLPSGTPLARLPTPASGQARVRTATSFSLPVGCPAQRLRLVSSTDGRESLAGARYDDVAIRSIGTVP